MDIGVGDIRKKIFGSVLVGYIFFIMQSQFFPGYLFYKSMAAGATMQNKDDLYLYLM